LLVDPGARQTFKRMQGFELVLGALIDQVHAAQTSGDPSCGITPPAPQAETEKLQAALKPESVFTEVVKAIEAIYGEQMLRKIWSI
ncbi:hypothetical protein, partial [Escherichia coli]|uniref:hypothetical protein n=5 Tax=Pseudomonadota TaxID=1224 RepID=UPI0013D261F1